jgi:hypothetical protein
MLRLQGHLHAGFQLKKAHILSSPSIHGRWFPLNTEIVLLALCMDLGTRSRCGPGEFRLDVRHSFHTLWEE